LAAFLAALPLAAQDFRSTPPPKVADPTEGATTLRVMSYNLHNFLLVDRNKDGKEDDPKPDDEKDALYTIVAEESPDLFGIVEVGARKFLGEVQDGLRAKGREYAWSEWVEGTDHSRHVALLSRYPIVARRPHTQESYDAHGEKFYVSRGILEADVRVSEALTVKVFVAHLKSKRTTTGPMSADDMRLEEAKILRKCVNDALAANPDLPLVLMGDFNDTPDSPSLKVILGDTQYPLTNAHPKNAKGYPGTYFYRPNKKFETIDYLLLSRAMAARFLPGSARIRDDKLAWKASDHFPVMADFRLGPSK
jgi:endonuclease/exonuclease/phosphatase family metal-dependent hydrolase